ncbi:MULTISPECIES: CoA transferase [unclassified Brevibacterium]|uniref:CaiB/BaiF CoA transferase family protein n=1 Tax=unclassified Brevibacterium TaxID=2614124 RepID=UPI0010F448AD|nr:MULTISPECIES: CoA transferase [unclassified Brevibacterium]MCM1013075.1 CoA transferase [Brevibacterium sp. XM4083]
MDENATGGGALAGVTVLELGVFMAGPFATMQLADLGARVIKIENPDGGDQTRSTGPYVGGESVPNMLLNRNKESITLDLKDPVGREAFMRLVDRADVVVENMRPGVMARLGTSYEEVAARNPRIIYASASGWGQDGPLAPLAGLDIMAQARSGLMSITGFPDSPPAKVGVPICDLTAAMYVALAVTSALYERDRSGQGQHIDVSLFESGVSYAVWEAAAYFTDGTIGRPNGSAHQNQAPYQAVHSSDGFVTVGANTPRNWERFCAALGLEELLSDERFGRSYDRLAHREALIALVEEKTQTMTTDEIVDVLNAAGVPCAPISDYGEVFTDDHLTARDFYWDSDHPVAGTVRQIGSPMRLSRTPARRGPAGPSLGADNAVLDDLGFTPEELAKLRGQ